MDPREVCVLGVSLNTCTLSFILYRRQYHRSYHIACLNITVLDLSYAIMGLTYYVILACTAVTTTTACEVSQYLCNEFFQLVDLTCIVPLVVDRFVAVMQPLRYKTSRLYLYVMVGLWNLSVFWCIMFFLFALNLKSGNLELVNDDIAKKFYRAEVFLFCIFPTIFNLSSFALIIHILNKTGVKRRLNLLICQVKVILTTLIFFLSWCPPTITFHLLKGRPYKNLLAFFYLNTLTDPFLYLIPNSLIIKALRRSGLIKKVVVTSIKKKRSTRYEAD